MSVDKSDACATNEHLAISMQKSIDEKPLKDDFYTNNDLHLQTPCLNLQNQEYIEKMKELQLHLDTVKKIVRPGCSQEVLNVALTFMASLVKTLSIMSSESHLLASL